MRFTYNGHVYRLWFSHHNKPGSIRYTECSIMEETGPNELKELTNSDAFCADSDNYCKAVGRKYALARALKALTSDRMFRHTAWMSYLNRGKKPSEQHVTQMIITGNEEIV